MYISGVRGEEWGEPIGVKFLGYHEMADVINRAKFQVPQTLRLRTRTPHIYRLQALSFFVPITVTDYRR